MNVRTEPPVSEPIAKPFKFVVADATGSLRIESETDLGVPAVGIVRIGGFGTVSASALAAGDRLAWSGVP